MTFSSARTDTEKQLHSVTQLPTCSYELVLQYLFKSQDETKTEDKSASMSSPGTAQSPVYVPLAPLGEPFAHERSSALSVSHPVMTIGQFQPTERSKKFFARFNTHMGMLEDSPDQYDDPTRVIQSYDEAYKLITSHIDIVVADEQLRSLDESYFYEFLVLALASGELYIQLMLSHHDDFWNRLVEQTFEYLLLAIKILFVRHNYNLDTLSELKLESTRFEIEYCDLFNKFDINFRFVLQELYQLFRLMDVTEKSRENFIDLLKACNGGKPFHDYQFTLHNAHPSIRKSFEKDPMMFTKFLYDTTYIVRHYFRIYMKKEQQKEACVLLTFSKLFYQFYSAHQEHYSDGPRFMQVRGGYGRLICMVEGLINGFYHDAHFGYPHNINEYVTDARKQSIQADAVAYAMFRDVVSDQRAQLMNAWQEHRQWNIPPAISSRGSIVMNPYLQKRFQKKEAKEIMPTKPSKPKIIRSML